MSDCLPWRRSEGNEPARGHIIKGVGSLEAEQGHVDAKWALKEFGVE